MRCLSALSLCVLALTVPAVPAGEAIFEPGAALKAEAGDGAGGEGPAWHPRLGVLMSGNGHINSLDRDGQLTVYRRDAGTNGLLFDRDGRLLACEPAQRRITRTEPNGTVTVLTYRYEGREFRLTDVHGEVIRDILA